METESNNDTKFTKYCEKFLSVFFCTVLVIICAMIFAKIAYNQIGKRVGWGNLPVMYDAAKDYPFESTSESAGESSVRRKSAIGKAKNLILSAEQKITMYCTENLPKRIFFVLPKKRLDKLMGLNMTTSMGVVEIQKSNDVVTNFDGEWLGSPLNEGSAVVRDEHIESVVEFANEMKAQGRDFFVFENPSKFCDCIGYKNAYAKNRDAVNSRLRAGGLEILDIDDYIAEHGIDYKDIFLKTDHHWQPRSGLWANAILCDYLNSHYGYSVDTGIFDLENYDIKVYKNQFLGSLGKKVTEVYAHKEDFELITPKFESDITMFSSATGKTKTGTIPDVFYFMDVFNIPNVYARNEYALYTNNQDCALIISHNNKKSDGTSVLLIHHSFADVQIPFLTQAFENFYAIDLRHFTGSLETFIKKKNPSLVILAYSTAGYQTVESAAQKHSSYDFR